MALTNRMLGRIWCCAQKFAAGNGKSWAPEEKKPPREVCKASDREGGGAQPAVTLPPAWSSRCKWAEWETGSGRSQSRKACPGRPLLPMKHANIHRSEMLNVVTGGQMHDMPTPPPPLSKPHAVTSIQTFLTTGKLLLNEKQRGKKKPRTHTKPEKDKQALSYVQEKAANRGRQKQQLCHGKDVLFTT